MKDGIYILKRSLYSWFIGTKVEVNVLPEAIAVSLVEAETYQLFPKDKEMFNKYFKLI